MHLRPGNREHLSAMGELTTANAMQVSEAHAMPGQGGCTHHGLRIEPAPILVIEVDLRFRMYAAIANAI